METPGPAIPALETLMLQLTPPQSALYEPANAAIGERTAAVVVSAIARAKEDLIKVNAALKLLVEVCFGVRGGSCWRS